MLITQGDLRATIIRLPADYGPRDYQLRVWGYLRRMEAARRAIVLPLTYSNWFWGRGYVKNIAAAICHLLIKDSTSSAVFNLGDPVVLSQKRWVEHIAKIAGWNGRIVIVPDDQLSDPLKAPIISLKIGRSMRTAFAGRWSLRNPLPLKNPSKRQSVGSEQIHRKSLLNRWNAGSKGMKRKTDGWRTRLRLAA